MSSRWVIDASSLIILGKLSLIDIVTSLCDSLIIPEGVAGEIMRGPPNDNAKSWLTGKGKKYIKNTGSIDLRIASWGLGVGESEVISYCYLNPQYTAIIDDRAAKKCAEAFSVKVKGTLALIVTAKEANLVPQVKPVLDRMINFGFRIKAGLYDKIIAIVNE